MQYTCNSGVKCSRTKARPVVRSDPCSHCFHSPFFFGFNLFSAVVEPKNRIFHALLIVFVFIDSCPVDIAESRTILSTTKATHWAKKAIQLNIATCHHFFSLFPSHYFHFFEYLHFLTIFCLSHFFDYSPPFLPACQLLSPSSCRPPHNGHKVGSTSKSHSVSQ